MSPESKKKRKLRNKIWQRKWREKPQNKIIASLRSRISQAMQSIGKIEKTEQLTGCSFAQLKSHLESQFQIGMSWDNYGLKGWHIDHIRPCASFDLSRPDEQKICFHYTNLQPLWAKDNLSKGAK
jgi:hypothetical protein